MAVDQLQQSSSPRPAEPAGKSNDPNEAGSNAEGRRRTLLFAAIIGCVILVGAVSFWLYSRTYESTDDAQVDGHLNGITARIDGDVKAVHVEENQSVQGGRLARRARSARFRSRRGTGAGAAAESAGRRARGKSEPPDHAKHFADQRVDEPSPKSRTPKPAVAAAERDQLAAQSRRAGGGGE